MRIYDRSTPSCNNPVTLRFR
jgi:hypothetical protein